MPNRLIRGTILESKKFNRLSEGAQNFFFRLMMIADDYGFYLRDPELIRSYAYPRMEKSVQEIESHLQECFAQDDPLTGKLLVDHGTYVEIRNFNQRLRLKKSSKYKIDNTVKNDRHMTVMCQSYDRQSPSSSSLEDKSKGGVGGEREGEQLPSSDELKIREKIACEEEIFAGVRKLLSEKIGKDLYDTWFLVSFFERTGKEIRINAVSNFVLEYIGTHFIETVKVALNEINVEFGNIILKVMS